MKLKTFNPDNCISSRSGKSTKPIVGINSKNGLFRMAPPVCDLLELKEGDHVMFHQDEEDPANWYAEKVKEGGFVLRIKPGVGKGLYFNNTSLARSIFASVGYAAVSGQVRVAGQPTKVEKHKLFALLTAGLQNK
jgi:hypothetical protein